MTRTKSTPSSPPPRPTSETPLADALRSIIQATSAATGPDFFRSLVKHLAEALQCRYALLGEAIGDPASSVRTLAVWTGQSCADNFEYDLSGTPCHGVIGRQVCLITRDAWKKYPLDASLKKLRVEAYLGVPLFDSVGSSIGILLVMHDRPHEFPHGEAVLRIFAARAAAEMERLWREQALRVAYETMEQRVRERTAEIEQANQVLQQEVARRKQAEQDARQNATELRMMLEAFPDLHFRLSADGRFLSYNAAPETELYIAASQFLNKRPRDFLPPDVARQIEDAVREVATTRSHVRIEYPLTVAGRDCWWEGRFAPFMDDQVLLIVRDMTERKRADGALQFQKSLLEAQGEASIEGILVVDNAGRVLSYNGRFIEMWHMPPELVATRSDRRLLAHASGQLADPDEFLRRVQELYQHPDQTSRDEVHLADGRIFDRYSAPIVSHGDRYYGRVWFFRDVTEQKRTEAALRQSEREALQSAESNRRLLMEVDHRVKNNLAGLLGLVQMTRTRASSLDSFASAIEGRLLAMSHIHHLLAEGGWREMDFRSFLSSLLRAIERLARHRIDVKLTGPPVMIHPHHALPLTMILVEWFTNSVKYGAHSAPTGQLHIHWQPTTTSTAGAPPRLTLHWTESHGPPVPQPVTPSLGTQLVESFATRELQGRCELTFPPTGASHTLEFPIHPRSPSDVAYGI